VTTGNEAVAGGIIDRKEEKRNEVRRVDACVQVTEIRILVSSQENR